MINLLYITNSLNSYSETFIRNTINELEQSNEINLHLAVHRNSYKQIKLKNKIANLTFYSNFFYRVANYILNLFKLISLLNFLNKELFYSAIGNIRNKYNLVWIDFGNNAVDIYKLFNKEGLTVIVHLHGFDVSKLLFNKKYSKNLIAFSKKNKIIVPSQYNKKRLILIGCLEENIFVIPYSFNFQLSHEDLTKTRVPNRLIFVGRFTEKKDPRVLVFVMKELLKTQPAAKLVMIGDGELYNEVKQLIIELKLTNNIELLGSLNHNQVVKELLISSVYVQHSLTSYSGDQEGLPNSIIEAIYCGLPVVSTIHAGIPEIVIDQINGLLVQEFDYTAMAKKIEILLADDNLRLQMSLNGLNQIDKICNKKERMDNILKLIKLNSNVSIS